MKNETRVEFDAVINGVDVCISFTRTSVFGRENYGADADGNRGMMINTIDADEYTQVSVEWEDEHGRERTFPMDEFPSAFGIMAVNSAIETYMEAHEPEPPDEPEHEYEPEDPDDSAWRDQKLEDE
jgi:hypothetical protein